MRPRLEEIKAEMESSVLLTVLFVIFSFICLNYYIFTTTSVQIRLSIPDYFVLALGTFLIFRFVSGQ